MKINILLSSIGHSGGIDVIYKYCELLEERGHDVYVYKKIMASNMHRYNNPIVNVMHQFYCSMKAVNEYNKRRKYDHYVMRINNQTVRDADVIIATTWASAFIVHSLCDNKGKKYHFIQDYEIWDNKELGEKSYHLDLNKIVISTWINEKLKSELGLGPYPIVMNGIDLSVFNPNGKKNESDTINVLMLNHKLKKKGVANGLAAYELAKRKIPNMSMRMFGLCDADDLPSYIEYHENPSKRELVDLYSSSDIFIFPSIEEGWGLTPIEAMACGCAVVGTYTGFVLDLGKDKENMLISQINDIDEMAKNICLLAQDSNLREKIKRNAIETVKNLDWRLSACQLEKLLMQ